MRTKASSWSVRDATAADLGALQGVRAGGAYERYLADAAAGSCAFLVAEADAGLAGFALVYLVAGKKSHVPKLSDVFVSPSARERGVGTALIAAGETRARAAGYHELFLSVDPDASPRMLRLVQALGYRSISPAPYTKTTVEGHVYRRLDLQRSL